MSEIGLDDLMGNALTEPIVDVQSNEEFDLEIIDDRPEEDRVPPRAESESGFEESLDDEVEEYSGRAGKRINKLKYEYHEERRQRESSERMREEAVRYAENMHRQNEELRNVLGQGENLLLEQMKSSSNAEMQLVRDQYKTAYEEGNTENLLNAQEALNRIQREKEFAESNQGVVPDHLRQPAPPPPTAQDPKLESWMSKNQWFGKDDEMTSLAYGVHSNLVKAGIDPHSDEYYNKIDQRVRQVFSDRFESEGVREEPVASSRTSTVVASAGRATNKPRKVQLTSTAVALAKRLGLTNQQYAKQLLKETR